MFEQNGYRYHRQSNEGAQQCTYSSPYADMIKELDDYCKRNEVEKAMEVVKVLEREGVILDLPRYELLMKMCGEVGHLQYAKDVHVYLMRSKLQIQVSVCNKILEMYFNCESVIDAYEVFRNMPDCDTTSWETMIRGLAKEGFGEEAIDLFTEFLDADPRPDGRMFMAVFSACSVLCDIDEGILHFKLMKDVYGIVPSMEHYLSVVDMLGSVGYLDEAMEFIENMPFEPSVDVWETMMNFCRVHGNTSLGDHCADIIHYLDPSRLTDESKGLLSGKAINSALNKERRLLSSGNIEKGADVFKKGDTSHPKTDIIYALLREMREHMKEVGYVPQTRYAMDDVEQEEKEESLHNQSEMLAVAKGLIETRARTPIRIFSNFRLCVYSHTELKIISWIVGRDLVIKAERFHHFRNGYCDCNDFW
ncbi:Pentatricopeptide repeat-containing protein [Thalictrum thalictroides]|uniref:Pentatricopeptide repeat-containing protein n=1 Tax=Thalictrum thalictroides TaxID=46969 RepID=A0A7J6X9E9_THATH|nr:Pentatricopeptide repeat-containing protein [Thalictrum thalictroides]